MLSNGSARARRAFLAPASLALLPALLGGCATTTLERSMELTGLPAVPEGFEAARREPLTARAHLPTRPDLPAPGRRPPPDLQPPKTRFQTPPQPPPTPWKP